MSARRPTRRPEDVARRRRAERAGRTAELVAVLLLRLKGYRIVARRGRTPLGEIDIVARRGPVLALVEVKRRTTLEAALEALGPRQRARIIRAAALLDARHPELRGLDRRFDLVLVTPWRFPVHLMDAWR
jgi:putative endonuclease